MIPAQAVEAAKAAAYAWGDEGQIPEHDYFEKILEAAAPHIAAQALEDAVIGFGQQSVYLTTAQETMANWMRKRAAELATT